MDNKRIDEAIMACEKVINGMGLIYNIVCRPVKNCIVCQHSTWGNI